MKLFCDLLRRHRSNKKKESIKSPIAPIQSINQSASSFSDHTSSLFDKHSRCTCHYFNRNENDSIVRVQIQQNSVSRPSINIESPSDMNSILTVADFCFWYDVRSTLLDMIDRVVAMDETPHLSLKQTSSIVTELSHPQSNQIHRRKRRAKTSIAIQTSRDNEQRRNAKVQTNTVTLFPLHKPNISSSRLFLD